MQKSVTRVTDTSKGRLSLPTGDANLPIVRSADKDILWPALTNPLTSSLLAQLYQLEQSQWLTTEQLKKLQLRQFARLARHAYDYSPFYRARLDAAGLGQVTSWRKEDFLSLPLLTRTELLTEYPFINCRQVPPSHGAIHETSTSGSTGQIVKVRRTEASRLTWLALNMREHLWHQRDFNGSLAVIRANLPRQDDETLARKLGWGPPVSLLYATGPGYCLPISTDVAEQAHWLLKLDPEYLLTYPTNLEALLTRFESLRAFPQRLREVRTIGESLSYELRAWCRELWGVDVVDQYSTQEVGTIALQCPASGLYHLQAESLFTEVLDEAGRPCRPGQIGRIVVTDLHNFATPLIRYEIRDYGEPGPPCPCGRGLPTLRRILGRCRNMITLPSGERFWPLTGFKRFQKVAAILQYQIIQLDLQTIEVRLVTVGPLSCVQEARLSECIQEALGFPFRLRFRYFSNQLPRTAGGKFEEVISHVV